MENNLEQAQLNEKIDTPEELLNLYGTNTGTETYWVIGDIPVVGQFSVGFAKNDVQTGLVYSGGVDGELLGSILATKSSDNNLSAEDILLGGISAYLDVKYSTVFSGGNTIDAIKSSVSFGYSVTNGLVEDLGGQTTSIGGLLPLGLGSVGGELFIPNNPTPLPFNTENSSWFMTPGAGWMVRVGVGVDVPDLTIGHTFTKVFSGQTRDEIYDAINRNRIIEENENNSSAINATPPNLDDIADFLQGLNSDLDNMDGLRGLGDVKLNTEEPANGGWPDDNNIANDNENRFAYMRAA